MRFIYIFIVAVVLTTTVRADLIPVHAAGSCGGDVLYHVEYSLDECQHSYGCNDGCTFDASACDGLTSDGLYQCTGQCAVVSGTSWKIDSDIFYHVYENENCNGDAFFSVNMVETPCFSLPGVACQAKSADISSLTGYYYNDSYYDDDDAHARSASTAAIADCLF